MRNKPVKLKRYTNPNIKIGMLVRLRDGSELSVEGKKYDDNNEGPYIVNAYPELTGNKYKLKNLPMEVIETGCENYVAGLEFSDEIIVFHQDIRVRYGSTVFRTSSSSVVILSY